MCFPKKPVRKFRLGTMNLIFPIWLMLVIFGASCVAAECNMEGVQMEANSLTEALKKTTWKAHTTYTEDSDVQYFADLSLDTGEHDHNAVKHDESLVNNAEGFVEEQQLRFLRQERERLADERDAERKQRLVLHMNHLQQNRYHVPKLLRKNKMGKVISDEEAYLKRGGVWRFVRLAITNWKATLGFAAVSLCDLAAFGASVILPYVMIQKMRRPGLMAGSGVRTPNGSRSRS